MRFVVHVIEDPDARARGFSLKGIKVPLVDFCPKKAGGLLSIDDNPVAGHQPHQEFWRLDVAFIAKKYPRIAAHLKGIDYLAVPTSWCQVAPVESLADVNY